MATAKELKERMQSIRETAKITNAMYLIASTKLQNAKREWDLTRPYFEAVQTEVKRIFRLGEHIESPYLYPGEGEPPLEDACGYLVITADKGMAGSYNLNVLREAERLMQGRKNPHLFVVGEYGRRYFARRGVRISLSFLYTAQNPTMDRAREIAAFLLDRFDKGQIKKIFVVYTDFNRGTPAAKSERVLPFHRASFLAQGTQSGEPSQTRFEFFPSPAEVLDAVVPGYLAGYIYSALADSFCSEQNARMNAMDAAGENADEMLARLGQQYQQQRQSAITQEITEIAAGARAI